ncbi:hypothetical protein BIWAKO_01301 [Bosea sp. BIWAKO-01]|nr:hypothetical protein BIWAKO_01301 [Bosea sp. BIWAKO-01]
MTSRCILQTVPAAVDLARPSQSPPSRLGPPRRAAASRSVAQMPKVKART